MPWHIEKRGQEFCVIKDDDGKSAGCHATRPEATKQMQALYSSENMKATRFTALSAPIALASEQDADDGKPQWIEVMPTAEKARNGSYYFTVTADDLEVYADWIRQHPAKVAIDRDHDTDKDRGSRAAGWFTGQAEVRETDNGPRLFAEAEWTPKARQEIREGEYRFLSAVFSFLKRGKDGQMTQAKAVNRATLTNDPFFEDLAPVTAEFINSDQLDAVAEKYGPEVADLLLAASDTEQARLVLATVPLNDPEKGTEMDLKVLATKLGLPEDADEAKVLAALEEKDEQIDTLKVEVETLKGPAAESDKLAERVQELETKDSEREAELLVKDAVTAGRIPPVAREEYLALATANFTAAKAIIEKMPAKGFTEVGSGGKGSTEPDIEAVRAEYGDDVDDESAALHARAMKILEEDGKAAGHTGDEYMAALERAEKVPA